MSKTTFSRTDYKSDPFQIRAPLLLLHPITIGVLDGLTATYVSREHAKQKSPKAGAAAPESPHDRRRADLVAQGHTGTLIQVTTRLSETRDLDPDARVILARQAIYSYLLYDAILGAGVRDAEGIYNHVLFSLDMESGPKQELYGLLVEAVVKSIRREVDSKDMEKLKDRAFHQGIPLEGGKTVPAVVRLLDEIERAADVPALVHAYLYIREPAEIDRQRISPRIEGRMVDYLVGLGVKVPPGKSEAELAAWKELDEYLALAYAHAASPGGDERDPLKRVYTSAASESWDFSVDVFDTVEERGIIRENILAAGVLDYVRVLGDELGIFKIVDAIILRSAQGRLDLPQGEISDMLYAYHKQRDNRFTEAERRMYYKQVFDVGDARTLDGMVVNTDFLRLWENLMSQVVRYIQKIEEHSGLVTRVSRRPIYQASSNLQYNLTVFSTGFVKSLVGELYNNQFKAATDILQHPQIVDQLGRGFRKNMWNVIERLAHEDFGVVPNVGVLHTIAAKGNAIFHWLADFDEATVTDQAFNRFLEDAEAYIIEQGQLAEHGDLFADDRAEPQEIGEEPDALEENWAF